MSILDPLYYAVSWVVVTFHNLLTPFFGTDSGVSWSIGVSSMLGEMHSKGRPSRLSSARR